MVAFEFSVALTQFNLKGISEDLARMEKGTSVISLKNSDYIDSEGIRILHRLVTNQGITKFIHVNMRTKELLTLFDFTQYVEIEGE